MTRRSALRYFSGVAAARWLCAQDLPKAEAPPADAPTVLRIGGATLEVTFDAGPFDLPHAALLDWVATAARAVSSYFGRFPVRRAVLRIVAASGRRRGSRINGVTFGEGGAHSRLTLDPHVTVEELRSDWVLTHEIVHYAFPSMERQHHWIEEGSATYIEPIARAAVGNLAVTQVWGDMVRDMPQGLPAAGDRGLDHTHAWGRTYWGGALFCLLADVGIRRKSRNRKRLVDALRTINRAGGNIEYDWPLERALEAGDKATGGKTLMTLYEQMAAKPMPVDLPDLWKQLGVKRESGQVTFDRGAPLAAVREKIC